MLNERAPRTERRRPIAEKLAGLVPYDLTFLAFYAFRSLQVQVWREVADQHITRVADVFRRYSGVTSGTTEFESWKAAYRRHTWIFMPAHLSAIAVAGGPGRIANRIDRIGWQDAAAAFPAGGILALSRTGLSIAVPWLLASEGLSVSIVAEPGGESDGLRRASERRPEIGRHVTTIDGDAKALFASRRTLCSGSRVLLFPEFGTQAQRLARIDFLAGSRLVPLGTASLAWLCSAPIVPVCAYAAGRRRITVEVATTLVPSDFASVDDLNTALFATMNSWAANHADQWVGWEYMCQGANTNQLEER